MSRKDTQNSTLNGPESRRERERRARLQAIRAAGARVFARHGFDAATMEEVATEAELGKATLYYYFETKQQLFADIVGAAAQQLRAIGEGELDAGREAEANLDALGRILVTYFREYPDFAVLLLPLHGDGHHQVAERIGAEVAKEVMAAHQPLLRVLRPFAASLAYGAALPDLVGSLLLGLAHKVQQGTGDRLEDEVELLCHLIRRSGAEE